MWPLELKTLTEVILVAGMHMNFLATSERSGQDKYSFTSESTLVAMEMDLLLLLCSVFHC